jgi:hypothetical protein
LKTKTKNSTTIANQFREVGFKTIILFAIVNFVAVVLVAPDSRLIPLSSLIFVFSIAVIALYKPNLSVLCANVLLVCVGPIVISLVLANGLMSVTVLSTISVLAVMLGHGYLRIVPVSLIASATLLVPFSGLDYDSALWLRLSVATFFNSAVVYFLASLLERALIDGLNKSDELKEALEGERIAYRLMFTKTPRP